MKFGETLQQRSIPQWANYNVDYDELKKLIKSRTTSVPTTPVAVPGQGPPNRTWTKLENELFPILFDQYERVNLFTRSKYGELSRRLDHVERQLKQMSQRDSNRAPNLRPVQQTRKYARIVKDAETIGEEIQSLSRFASVQRLAFKKILKKYQKWTGSTSLQLRMNNEVFNKPAYSLQPDFTPLLERLSEVTGGVEDLSRLSPKKQLGNHQPSPEPSKASPGEYTSSASQLHDAANGASRLDFDAKFSTVPLGVSAARASYWIHPDNLDEAKVLLMRHMRNRSRPRSSFSRTTSVNSIPSHPSRGGQFDGSPSGPENDRLHVAMFDNLQRLVQEQNATAADQKEDQEGSVPSKVALRVQWTEDVYAVAVTSDLKPSIFLFPPSGRHAELAHVKRRELPKLLSRYIADSPKNVGSSKKISSNAEAEVQSFRDFLAQHRDVKPLAEIHSKRCRFVGINNSVEVGVWAVLDEEITMTPIDSATVGLTGKNDLPDNSSFESAAGHAFPHAVLEIRWEFSRMPELVRAFDNTHLAERIRRFSMETHTIYTICNPKDMPQPHWQPLLSRDIRKMPPKGRRMSQRGSENHTRGSSTTINTSSGPPSSNGPTSSGFSASVGNSSATSLHGTSPTMTVPPPAETKRVSADAKKPPKQRGRKKTIRPEQTGAPAERYWNEFDDGEEFQDDQAFAIYVNPDEPFSFPGVEAISKAFSAIQESLRLGRKRLGSLFSLRSRDEDKASQQPLLGDRARTGSLDDSSDSDTAAPAKPARQMSKARHQSKGRSRQKSRGRSMSSFRQQRVRRSRENNLFKSYCGLFFVSLVLLGMMSALVVRSGSQGLAVESSTGVLIGVVAALGCGLTGVGLMLLRNELLSWLHFTVVALVFCFICVVSGVLLAFIGRSY